MKYNKLAVSLSISYLVACVVFNVLGLLITDFHSFSDLLSVYIRLYYSFFMPVVMTAVLAFFMSREKCFSELLLFFTFVTYGAGAIFYPLWLKKQEAPHFAQLNRYLLIYGIALAVNLAWPFVELLYVWGEFLCRNVWAAYLPYFYNVVMAYLAFSQLREMNCKHVVTWVCAIVLMLCASVSGVLVMALLYALYGNDFKTPNYLTKYWVVLASCMLLSFVWQKVYSMLMVRGVYWVMDMSWVGSVIYDLSLVLVFIFLIRDFFRTPIKGKVWLMLPILVSFIFPLLAIEAAKGGREVNIANGYIRN